MEPTMLPTAVLGLSSEFSTDDTPINSHCYMFCKFKSAEACRNHKGKSKQNSAWNRTKYPNGFY